MGSCKLLDSKMEKNGTFEITPAKDDKFFECEMLKGALNSGQEQVVKFNFN